MISDNHNLKGNERLKKVTIDSYGREVLLGYTFTPNNNVASRGYIITSFTHPEEREIIISERQMRMRYSLWTEEDDKALEPEPEKQDWSEYDSAMHCLFCGKEMVGQVHKSGYPQFMRCNHCDISFDYHGAGDESKSPGDSFSITYWK